MKSVILSVFFIGISHNMKAQDFVWGAAYEGESSIVTSLSVDDDGNSYSAVLCIGTVDVDPGPANWPIDGGPEGRTVIQKLDVNGDLIWVSEFIEASPGDGIIGNGLEVNQIKLDVDGNLLLTGSTSGRIDYDPSEEEFFTTESDYVYHDIFILKLNEEGGLIWVQTLGSPCLDFGQAIETDQNEDIYVTGTFCNTVDFDFGAGVEELETEGVEGSDIFVLKLSSSGDFIWVKSIKSVFEDQVFDLVIDKSNNVYVGGLFTGVADFDLDAGEHYLVCEGEEEAFLLKLNSEGEFNWVNTISGPAYGKVTSLALDFDENICAVGDFTGDDIDFDPSAEVFNLSSVGDADIFVAKYTSASDLIWVNQLGSSLNESSAQIEISAINTIYITGGYEADIDVDPSVGTFILPHAGTDNQDLFFLRLNEEGGFISAIGYNGDRNEVCNEIVKGTDGSVYLAGSTNSELDINHTIDEFMLYGDSYTPTGYVLKLQDGNVGIRSNDLLTTIGLYPNPSQGLVNVDLLKVYDSVEIQILNQLGQVLQSSNVLDTDFVQFNLNVPNGVYLIRIITNGTEEIFKLIKE